MAASHYKLDNLIAIVDRNGIQNDGSTEEIMALEPLAEKWKAFGWEVIETDGSNLNELIRGLNQCKSILGKPKVIISYLIKGADVSFMQHTQKYHQIPLLYYTPRWCAHEDARNQHKNQHPQPPTPGPPPPLRCQS